MSRILDMAIPGSQLLGVFFSFHVSEGMKLLIVTLRDHDLIDVSGFTVDQWIRGSSTFDELLIPDLDVAQAQRLHMEGK